jgi:ABC-2 type transport system permease protein
MRTIVLIVQREFLVRVKKKSFLIVSMLGPIAMLMMMIVPYWVSSDGGGVKTAVVVDETGEFKEITEVKANYTLVYQLDDKGLKDTQYDAIVILSEQEGVPKVQINSGQRDAVFNELMSYFVLAKTNQERLRRFAPIVHRSELMTHFEFMQNDESKGLVIKQFISYGSGILIYFFIFLYGIQVMKGIIEEKTNRIVEVVITTVKPMQLMLGKIFGLASVGFVQFMIWLVSSSVLTFLFAHYFQINRFGDDEVMKLFEASNQVDLSFVFEMNNLVTTLQSMNIPFVVINFSIFFLLGYLIYASLFAIVGAASDIDTDTQQFIFPITVPLLTSMMLIQPVLMYPDGVLANVLSMMPLSAPIITTARLPFADHIVLFEVKWLASLLVTFVGFLFMTWVASRIYKIGILSYGQKVGYKELWQWFRGYDL